MRSDEIIGLTPKQIKNKFSLEYTPDHICDFTIPKGTVMRTGIAGEIEGWGTGGGIQFDLMGQRVGIVTNRRAI